MLLAAHFSQPPEWRWYILGYFFLAGLAGGAYVLGTMLRLWGRPADEPAARVCFLLALPLTVLCPILLTLDLGQPARFWHMMIDAGGFSLIDPRTWALAFKTWSPMSMGVWALVVFGAFATVSFIEAAVLDGHLDHSLGNLVRRLLSGAVGRAVNIVGSLVGLFVAGYTGVLLSVSNQPVWSDTYALGGLFLVSGLSGAAASITLATRWRPEAAETEPALAEGGGYFSLLELALIAVLFISLAFAGQLLRTIGSPWWILWVVALLSLVPPLAGRFGGGLTLRPGVGGAMLTRVGVSHALGAVIVLVGVLAMRAAVLWSAQG